jgi:adenylate kinase
MPPIGQARRWDLAVTGTPGVGKSTLAAEAARLGGWKVVDVKAWAEREGCVVDYDAQDEAMVIDVEALAKRMPKGGNHLFEGHLSHLLPVDAAWVVRCDPLVLKGRLLARGYPVAKVVENLEAEATDIILQEALDHVPFVVQRDGTRRSPTELFKAFAEVPFDRAKSHHLEPVDWSDRLPIELP